MERGYTEWQMETFMKASGKTIREMAMELVRKIMEKFMRGVGKTTKKTEKEN
jgi:hypothetical protein